VRNQIGKPAPNKEQVASGGRLQRPPDFTGDQIQSFSAVFLRHGLPCALLGLLFLTDATVWPLLKSATAAARENSTLYLISTGLVFLCLLTHAALGKYPLVLRRIGWIVYLGCLSVWEEWVFRIGIPHYLGALGIGILLPILISNTLFGILHYFTLRWRWQWCLMAAIGGLFFSYNFVNHQNLLLIAGIHWVMTYLNTPRMPNGDRRIEQKPPTGQLY
jgi:hypothetical protein